MSNEMEKSFVIFKDDHSEEITRYEARRSHIDNSEDITFDTVSGRYRYLMDGDGKITWLRLDNTHGVYLAIKKIEYIAWCYPHPIYQPSDKYFSKTEDAEDKCCIKDSGNRREFETGAVRDIQEGKGRCDLMPLDVVGHMLANPTFSYIYNFTLTCDFGNLEKALTSSGIYHDIHTMFLEVAKHFEAGAKKYGEDNWQKGIPTHCYIDSAVRHYLKYLRGDTDEPHDRAFCWNILCCIWTCIHKPELNDYAKKENT